MKNTWLLICLMFLTQVFGALAQTNVKDDNYKSEQQKESEERAGRSKQLVVIGVPNIKEKSMKDLTDKLSVLDGVIIDYFCQRDKVFVLYVDKWIYDSPFADMEEAVKKYVPYARVYEKQMDNLNEYKNGCK